LSTRTPRRRILRPPQPDGDPRRQQKLARRREKLRKEQQNRARWMTRLKRAFHAVEKHQRTVARLEREIGQLEQG